nr:F-box/LRR-repeat protein At3g26922-like [Ipomoea batatas]
MAALVQSNQPSSSMEAEMVDRISDLPIPILHHILSFLPTREVVRTCVLSKHWHSTSSSFPILEFDIYDVRSYRRGSYNNPIKDEEFLRWVDARVQRLYETNTSIVSLTVAVDLLDPRIFRAIERAVERNVEELDLDFDLLNGRFQHQNMLYYSARSVVVYKLGGIDLHLPDLLRGCPLLQELNLRSCLLQETTIVNDANNLKTLVFKSCRGMRDFVIRAPNLESFAYSGGSPCAIHLAQTSSLKNLRLCGHIFISEQWLENLIRGCPNLEFLKIYCNGWERMAIRHQRLKTLKLHDWTSGGFIKIDTPELLHFTYHGTTKPFYTFNYSASLKATLNLFRYEEDDAPWFASLRKMLGWFSQCETLQLAPHFSPEDLIFGMDIRDNSIPLVYGLKNLEIQFRTRRQVPFIELIDTYLWLCPHLETLKIACKDAEEAAFKFEREHRNMALCCAEHPGECWKFSVKKVTLTSYVGRNTDKKSLLSYFQRVSAAMETVEDSSDHSKLIAEESFFLVDL